MSDQCPGCSQWPQNCTCVPLGQLINLRMALERIQTIESERDALKAELHTTNEIALDVMRERDDWHSLCGRMAEALKGCKTLTFGYVEKTFNVADHKTKMIRVNEALSEYEAMNK